MKNSNLNPHSPPLSMDNEIRIWDTNSYTCLVNFTAHAFPVSAVCFNRDGTHAVSCGDNGKIRIWDSYSGALIKDIMFEDDPNGLVQVSFAKFSPNGKYILVGAMDDKLRLFSYDKCLKTYTGHKNHGFSLIAAFSVTGNKGKVK